MKDRDNFCPVFKHLQQLADKKGLNPENTVLNNDICPFAQACLGIAKWKDGWGYHSVLDECDLKTLENDPPYLTIYLHQRGTQPFNPQEAF